MDQIKKLSDTEIEEIIRKMDRMFLEEGYEKTYEWALRLIKEYPNCNMLIWQAAVMLDARRITDSTMTCRNDLISCMINLQIWKRRHFWRAFCPMYLSMRKSKRMAEY